MSRCSRDSHGLADLEVIVLTGSAYSHAYAFLFAFVLKHHWLSLSATIQMLATACKYSHSSFSKARKFNASCRQDSVKQRFLKCAKSEEQCGKSRDVQCGNATRRWSFLFFHVHLGTHIIRFDALIYQYCHQDCLNIILISTRILSPLFLMPIYLSADFQCSGLFAGMRLDSVRDLAASLWKSLLACAVIVICHVVSCTMSFRGVDSSHVGQNRNRHSGARATILLDHTPSSWNKSTLTFQEACSLYKARLDMLAGTSGAVVVKNTTQLRHWLQAKGKDPVVLGSAGTHLHAKIACKNGSGRQGARSSLPSTSALMLASCGAQSYSLRVNEHPQHTFATWLLDLKADADKRGLSSEVVARAFEALVEPIRQPRVSIDSSTREKSDQPTTLLRDYIRQMVPQRVARGVELLGKHEELLLDIHRAYGVPPELVLSIWGIETNYGSYMGEHDVIQALVNQAFGLDGTPLGTYFRGEVLSALELIQDGSISIGVKGSYAGAFGQCQFMPSSYQAFAVDHDNDGFRDIFTSVPDTFASIANFLILHGYTSGSPYGTLATFEKEV
jgi:membrane-bound lytic murein transglycosylase B